MFIVKRRKRYLVSAALALGVALSGASARADYPERPVTILVPWGAGGGTDTIIRIFAVGFEEAMGQPINVVNRTGGNGVVGHSAIANAEPDGYTLGACTSEITYFKTLGLADITPQSFDLISRLAVIPAGVTVKADAGYEDLNALLDAARNGDAGALTSSGSGLGGPWHMAVAGLEQAAGMNTGTIKFIPSKGGAPALQDLVAGGITMFTGSPIEAKALADAGEVRVLATMSEQRLDAFPDVPTVSEATGLDWTLSNWFSLCAPSGLPDDVKAKIVAAAEQAHGAEAVQSALQQRSITPLFDGPDAFSGYAGEFATTAAALLKDLGLAK